MKEEIVKSKVNSEQPKANRFARLKSRKVIISIVIAGLIFASLFYFKSAFVAAMVNGTPVTRLSVIQALEKQGGKNTLDALITERLIENEAKKKGIAITNEEVDAEIKKIETSITQQGGTLNDALLQQGMTMEALGDQIKVQKMIEKLLADKIQVTDEEVTKYVEDNKVTLESGKETETKDQIRQQLQGQKLNQEAQAWIASLKASAKVDYYVTY